MSLVAQAASAAFGSDKMNYELLGMGDAHLHWHLYPRRNGDLDVYGNNGKGPMNIMYDDSTRPSPQELDDMKRRLKNELDKLI